MRSDKVYVLNCLVPVKDEIGEMDIGTTEIVFSLSEVQCVCKFDNNLYETMVQIGGVEYAVKMKYVAMKDDYINYKESINYIKEN